MFKDKKPYSESIFNIVLLILGLFITVSSLQIGFGTLKRPASGLFPFFCGILLILVNLGLLLFRRNAEKEEYFSSRERRHLVLIISVFVFWVLLMPFLGYLLVTWIATYSFSKIMGMDGWRKPFLLSLGVTGLCYLLFDLFLYLDLPRGIRG